MGCLPVELVALSGALPVPHASVTRKNRQVHHQHSQPVHGAKGGGGGQKDVGCVEAAAVRGVVARPEQQPQLILSDLG